MYIYVQRGYSTDIHLFKNGQPGSNAAEPVGTVTEVLVALADENASRYSVATAAAVNILQNNITYDTDTDETATSQSFVQVTAQLTTSGSVWMRLIFKVAPNAQPGQTYCRITYQDGVAAHYSNIMFRVTVHDSLTRIWLGNSRLTLFNKPSLAADLQQNYARQVVVYGECLDAGGVTAYADLTGSTYIDYTPSASITCSDCGLVRANFTTGVAPQAPAQLKGSVQVKIGAKRPEPLPGTTAIPSLPIYVRDGTKGSRKLLRRFHIGKEPNMARKLKLLVLTQGFKDPAERKAWLDLVKDQLFDPANTPFDKLRESIDLWTADLPIDDPDDGLSLKSPLNQNGYLVPTYPIRSVDKGSIYTIRQLLSFVGLPSSADASLTLPLAQAQWQTKLANPHTPLRPFDPTKVSPILFDAWKQQVPAQFVYAKDTPLDYAKGTSDLRISSKKKLTRGDWGLGGGGIYFPLVNDDDDSSLKATIASLDSNFATIEGATWDPNSADDLAAGFVCVVVNDHTHGAVAQLRRSRRIKNLYVGQSATFSIGTEDFYTPTSALPVTNVQLNKTILNNTQALIDARDAVKSFVHEFGHTFGFDDEYGNGYSRPQGHSAPLARTSPSVPVDESMDIRPNVATAEQLNTLGVAALTSQQPLDPATGLPLKDSGNNTITLITGKLVHPEKLKWNWDRTELAAALLAAPQAGSTANSFKLKVAADQNWKSKLNSKALIRKRALSTLKINPSELYEVVIKAASLDPTNAFYELQVEGTLPRDNANKLLIGENDVIYIPRYYPQAKATDPLIKMRLIANEVADLLKTSEFKMTDDVMDYKVAARNSSSTQLPKLAFQNAMTVDILTQGKPGPVRYAWRIVGIYEGGGEYDSGAYRPSGQSKMRAHYDIADSTRPIFNASGVTIGYNTMPSVFNYVCQYYIVNRVNPNILPALDADYDKYTY
jgi:hypothetical protein